MTLVDSGTDDLHFQTWRMLQSGICRTPLHPVSQN